MEIIEENYQVQFQSALDLEKDPAYKLLGNIPLECLSDIDAMFTEGVAKMKYIVTIKAGNMFGELGKSVSFLNAGMNDSFVPPLLLGLLMKKPRAATILA